MILPLSPPPRRRQPVLRERACVAHGDAGHGAAVGATAGVVVGGARSRRNQAAQAQQVQASKSQAIDTYYRAYSACMQGRGYTVK